jgi:radical SAM protein with 4Fe4S-binding SPASM domain
MEQALFARIVDEAAAGPRTKPLTLHNLGESLLHPGLPAFVALATSRGLTTELSANPGHLSPERYQALEDAGLGRLVLDVDGLDQQTLESIRGPGARGDRAFAWLDAVLDHRRRHPRQYPHIVLQMIRQRQNAHQHEAFLEKYGAMGIEGVDAYLKEVDANTVETSAAGGLPIFVEHRPRRPYLCRAPWRSVVVLVDGSVVPCCHDENGRVVLGNLSSQSLAEIWSGPEVAALRERLRTNSLMADEPCATCAHRADRYPLPDLDDVAVEPLHW